MILHEPFTHGTLAPPLDGRTPPAAQVLFLVFGSSELLKAREDDVGDIG